MKRLLTISAFCLMTFCPTLWAIPSAINYQGTLKEQGLPVTGNRKMTFQLTNSDGSVPYSNAINIPAVNVINGLFAEQLNFQLLPTYTWDTINPYIQVSVEDQVLRPAEPVSATVYAIVTSSVVDNAITVNKIADGSVTNSKLASGAVTSDKLDPTVQGITIPSGMIAMFATNCPSSGWTRFSALDNAFPMGSATYGATGGSATHSHNVLLSPHTHSISNSTLAIAIGIRNINWDNNLVMQPSSAVGSYSSLTANQWFGGNIGNMSNPASTGTNPGDVAVQGPRISGGTDVAQFSGPNVTDSQSNLPPYLGVVFCQKQ